MEDGGMTRMHEVDFEGGETRGEGSILGGIGRILDGDNRF
jgi:hypothetical protein